MEAADAGIHYSVCITDGIPTQDMMRVKRYMRRYRSVSRMRLTGPNCAGTITPGAALLGIMPGHIYLPGRVGIIGRSGTLGYEAAAQRLQALGIGVSTSVGIGGDPVNGSSFRDLLELFEADGETDAVVMVGEIGGGQEAEAAAYVRDHMSKPVIAFIAGLAAPKGRRMDMRAPSCRPPASRRRRRSRSCTPAASPSHPTCRTAWAPPSPRSSGHWWPRRPEPLAIGPRGAEMSVPVEPTIVTGDEPPCRVA